MKPRNKRLNNSITIKNLNYNNKEWRDFREQQENMYSLSQGEDSFE